MWPFHARVIESTRVKSEQLNCIFHKNQRAIANIEREYRIKESWKKDEPRFKRVVIDLVRKKDRGFC